MTSNPSFEPYCPFGGSWYACGNGAKFTGCCGEDPCNDNGCSAGQLYAASFQASNYGLFPDQECGAGLWYTCVWENQTVDTFMGCCQSNPCSNKGCPVDSLAAGYLSSNPTIAQQFDPFPPLPTAVSSATTTSSTASNTSAAASSSQRQSSSSPVAIIAGSVAGGAVFILAVILIAWRIAWRSRRKRAAATASSRYDVAQHIRHDPPLGHFDSFKAQQAQRPFYGKNY